MSKIVIWKKVSYFVVLPLSVVLLVLTGSKFVSTQSKLSANDATISNLNAQILQNSPSTIKVDASGSENSGRVANTNQLTSLFTKMTTWTDGKTYTHNRNQVKQALSGDAFYKTFYPEDKDSTGQSMIDALGVKSKVSQISVYQVNDSRYRIVVSSYGYKRPSDLENIKNARSSDYSFVVEGNLDHWKVVRIDEGFEVA